MIKLDHLTKSFRGKPALHDLSLEIRAGEIFGLLGHNGAGKSTTFGLLLGQIFPTSGEAYIRGVSVQKHRLTALQKTGAIFEEPAFYDYLSGWNNLRILTDCSAHVSDAELRETIGFVGLEKRIHDPVRVYSHGMRQRLALAQALLPQPDLIFLDEPAEGLDPEGMHEMRGLIQRLNRERGMTVLLSSHLLVEVEQLCDRIAILNRGQLVFQGLMSELGGSEEGQFRLTIDDWAKAAGVFAAADVKTLPDGIVALPAAADIADLVAALVNAGVRVSGVESHRRTLEALYLETVARE